MRSLASTCSTTLVEVSKTPKSSQEHLRHEIVLMPYPAQYHLCCLHPTLFYSRKGNIERKPLRTKMASNLQASTFTRIAKQQDHETVSQNLPQQIRAVNLKQDAATVMSRYRSAHAANSSGMYGSGGTNSASSRYHDPVYVLRKCPDCGLPHQERGRRPRDKASLRVATQSDTHTSSGLVSESTGAPPPPLQSFWCTRTWCGTRPVWSLACSRCRPETREKLFRKGHHAHVQM